MPTPDMVLQICNTHGLVIIPRSLTISQFGAMVDALPESFGTCPFLAARARVALIAGPPEGIEKARFECGIRSRTTFDNRVR